MQRGLGFVLACAIAVLAQVSSVALDGLALVVPDALRIRLDEAAIEDTSGETLVIVGFDGFEIVDRNSRLIADLTQAHASLLACESQLFAYTSCHLRSLDSWRRVVGL